MNKTGLKKHIKSLKKDLENERYAPKVGILNKRILILEEELKEGKI